MRICFVIRSFSGQGMAATYTTTHLSYEAYRRGHRVSYTTINNLTCSTDGLVYAHAATPKSGLASSRIDFLNLIRNKSYMEEECLSTYDIVFLRHNVHDMTPLKTDPLKSPAFEFARLLKMQGVMVINDPNGLAKAASKMYLVSFPSHIRATTLITRSAFKIKNFVRQLKKPVVLKPLSGFGGHDVFYIKDPKEININQIISAVSKNGYMMAQEYMPEVKKGDKRLLLLQGDIITIGQQVAIYRRMSPKGEIRSNIHIGGRRKEADCTESDRAIVEAIRPKLISDGLYFVGVDIVGHKLLEINVFCPGGINNINELYNINVGEFIIEDLERRSRVWKRHAPMDRFNVVQ